MSDPNDPNHPAYGQTPQQVFQSTPNSGMHLIQGVGNVAMGLFHLFAGGGSDDEAEAEEQRPQRRFRSFGARPIKRAGTGSCCRRPSGK